jgi:hypothetical protein
MIVAVVEECAKSRPDEQVRENDRVSQSGLPDQGRLLHPYEH